MSTSVTSQALRPPGEPPAGRHGPLQTGLCLQVLRLGAVRRLQVRAEFVHVIERLCEESPTGVDLHQGQVIQLKHKGKQTGLVESLISRKVKSTG